MKLVGCFFLSTQTPSLLLFAALSFVIPNYSNSFVYPAFYSTSNHRSTYKCSYDTEKVVRLTVRERLGSSDEISNDDGAFDIETIRKRLESLVSGEKDISPRYNHENSVELKPYLNDSSYTSPIMRLFAGPGSGNFDEYQLPPPPPITSISRERKETEILLLQDLAHGDTSIAQLWHHWFNERGPKAASKLNEANELIEKGFSGYDEAERILYELIKEYGIYWAEPSNRLATLYYLKGNLKASEAVCLVVLAVKPWHFGALSGLSLVYSGLEDKLNARQWASRSLPAFSTNGSNLDRETWVKRAVAQAKESLQSSQKQLHSMLGNQDPHLVNVNKQRTNTEIGDVESWQ